jgi:hypothetical protein
MVPITSLLVPVLVAAVLVFLTSSVIHMLLPWHKGDLKRFADEDAVADALRRFSIPPGDYLLPCPTSASSLKDPAFIDRMTKGPVAVVTVRPNGPPAMGAQLGLWFVYAVIVGVFAAYIAGRALGPGAHYLQVFRFAGCSAFMGYSLALMQNSIWWSRNWGMTLKTMIDGLVYALLTAGTFGWLWPR